MELSTELVAALIALIGAITALVKSRIDINQINSDRDTTKESRDKDSQELHDKVLKLEFQCGQNKDTIKDYNRRFEDTTSQINLLNKQLVEVLVRIDTITEILKEIKESKKVSNE